MKRRLSAAWAVLFALVTSTGCAVSAAPSDDGDFLSAYQAPEDPELAEIHGAFQEIELLEGVLAVFNQTLALPHDVGVIFGECGVANAFYDPDTAAIVLCYELVDELADIFYEGMETEEELEAAAESIAGANLFILFHEIGHALIDVYDLPITGREEDAVDQLATVLLVESGDEAWELAALDAAMFFGLSSERTELTEESFWDEHSLEAQRFYSIVCWILGSDPERWGYLVEEEYLPAYRAERCPAEYERMASAWGLLLDPYPKAG